LLAPPPRVGGKRRYPNEVVNQIRVIDLARHAGFSLPEIAELLEGVAVGLTPSSQWADFATRKLPEVDAVIERAVAMRRVLERLARCECPTLEDCADEAGTIGLPDPCAGPAPEIAPSTGSPPPGR